MIIVALALQALPAAAESPCGPASVVEKRQPAVPFQAFDMVDPETGRRYHPNDLIQVTKDDGKTTEVRAQDYFDSINATEKMLNEWGYSLRDGADPQTLSRLNYCAEQMEAQRQIIDKTIRDEQTKFLEDETSWLSRWNTMRDEYTKDVPSWEELYRRADDDSYKVYMPPVPAYQPPRPTYKPREISFSKEKSYTLYEGKSDSFSVGVYPYYKVGATKVEAVGEAGLNVRGGMVGQWEGEIASFKLNGRSPGTGPLKIDFVASVINGKKTWTKPLVEVGKLSYYDSVRASEAYELTYRFAVGPIPMAAQVGLRGEAGFQWGSELMPLQLGAFAGPFAAIDAYVQVGADVGIAGVGVGGRLRIAEYSLMLQGQALFDWVDEPEVTVSVALTSDLTLLAGDLYAYAYLQYPVPWPPWKKRSEWRHSFFAWEGVHKTGKLFDYKARINRSGLVAEGDLSPEDVLEMTHANHEAYVDELDSLADRAALRAGQIHAALAAGDVQSIGPSAARIETASAGQAELVRAFWESLQ
jgi:hypothetical protein